MPDKKTLSLFEQNNSKCRPSGQVLDDRFDVHLSDFRSVWYFQDIYTMHARIDEPDDTRAQRHKQPPKSTDWLTK